MELLSVDFDKGGLSRTRAMVSASARRLGMTGERLGDLLGAVNECLVNAVEHGGGRGRLRMWERDGRLVCEVADRGPGIPAGVLEAAVLPGPSSLGGRGIWLTRRLSDETDYVTGPGGTVVRLAMDLLVPATGGKGRVRLAGSP
ncbi:ATP-binding protein [Nonomuraea purpurea]|uniref:ATP-binding protein n=1 Tax=Nonomuraea purpurea TaxID=1849276 RepID=A0ABV8FYM7_9ACTN